MNGPRLWPPLLIVGIALAVRFVPGWIAPLTMVHFIGLGVGPLLGILGLLIWWLFARSIPWKDRLIGLPIGIGILVLGFLLAHATMPQFLVVYSLVLTQLVFVATLCVTRAVAWRDRRFILALGLAVAFLPWIAFRQDGQVGDLAPHVSLRWAATAEERFLDARAETPAKIDRPPVTSQIADWPGYRGPSRDGRVADYSFDPDWSKEAPRELWRRRVGPGWSSFAVAGDLAFTQEQRGEDEAVVAYSMLDGREIWAQSTPGRFEEPASGPGPRATPTFDGGRLFTLGANGTLQCLDAATGKRRWQRSLTQDVGAPLPVWGFTSSPLVVGQVVIVFAGSQGGRSVVAFDRETGDPLWNSGDGAVSYSSAHLATIDEVEQVLMSTDAGLQALAPETGKLLWEHRWPTPQMPRIVQPVVLDGGNSVILATGYGYGSRRLNVTRDASGSFAASEVWSSRFLKPYFNGLVCNGGSCYGFDGKIFTCIGADDGERRWKGGRYGHGQVVLLPDMDLLLVLTEKGEVVLVEATPQEHRELARFQALTGKTWNHPVVTQGRLLVRNAEEAACFEL